MKKIFAYLLAIALVSACTPPHQHDAAAAAGNGKLEGCKWQMNSVDACLQVVWESGPTVGKRDGAMKFRLIGPASSKTPNELILLETPPYLEIFMPAMGHGSDPIKVSAVKGEPGVYRATGIFFSMFGHWEFRVRLLDRDDKNKILDQIVIPLDL